MMKIYSRLHRDEKGTSMTEFVITLPVFVMVFWGILHLFRMEDRAVQAEATAFAKTMTEAKTIQTQVVPLTWAAAPLSAVPAAVKRHTATSSGADLATDLALDTEDVAGHMMTSWSRLLLAGGGVGKTVGLEPPQTHMFVKDLMETRGAGQNYDFSLDILRDNGNLGVDTNAGWMSLVNSVVSSAGVRPAIGAGMRYGVAFGKVDKPYSAGPFDYNIQTVKHVPSPTRPTSKWASLAVIYTELESDPDDDYSEEILAFQMDLNVNAPEFDDANNCVQDTMKPLDDLKNGSLIERGKAAFGMVGMLEDLASGNLFANCGSGGSSPPGLGAFNDMLGGGGIDGLIPGGAINPF